MCKVISVSNQKGGVGKTVTSVNLEIGLARAGKKVLMIDAEPQGSMTISLGYTEPDKLDYSLATVMMNVINDEAFALDDNILHHEEGILLTMVDNRTNYAKDIAAQVHDTYSSTINVFKCEIPLSVRAAEISTEGSSLYTYDPKGKAACTEKVSG